MNHIEHLTIIFNEWTAANDLPSDCDAIDLLRGSDLTDQQEEWLIFFSHFWNCVQDSRL